ncbi:hypothetical protein C5167_017823 [Papaver somniferum]|uniref:Uncharacterized protein n=1 Tax=Papaver somniferum TaxID=3469 RepID=A0A4Y7IMQ5_PAPSO|nr:hypothetical protein C5167_017823 [Papaver somniferum]
MCQRSELAIILVVIHPDIKDILFICGGAFIDLEKTISERWQDSSICFGAPALASCCDFVFYGIRKNSYLSGIHGIAIASEGPTHQVFVVSLDDLSGDEDQACKKFRLRVEDVQRKNVLTNFWANSPRSETNRSGEPVMLNLARFERDTTVIISGSGKNNTANISNNTNNNNGNLNMGSSSTAASSDGENAEIASEGPTHQVFVVSLDDLSGDEDQACKKFRLRVEDVQRKNVLTNFWANSPRSETNRSGEPVMLNLARFESIFLLFHDCIICTLYCRTRRQMVENMVSQASSCDLTELVAKFIPAMIGKDIMKATSSIYPLQNVFIWKVGDHKFDKIIDAGAMYAIRKEYLEMLQEVT